MSETASAKAVEDLEGFLGTVAPRTESAAALLAPAGDDWWRLVTGLAPEVGLVDETLPVGATWVAYTDTRSFTQRKVRGTFTAVHIRFDDPEAAEAYAIETSNSGSVRTALARGHVVTVAPSWVDLSKERLPELDGDHGTADLDVDAGAWRLDLDVATTAGLGQAGEDYAQFASALGLADRDQWTAVSDAPFAPWAANIGAPTNPDPEAALVALRAMHESYYRIDDLKAAGSFRARGGITFGVAADQLPELDENVVMVGEMSPASWMLSSTNVGGVIKEPLGLAFTLADDGTLTLVPTERPGTGDERSSADGEGSR